MVSLLRLSLARLADLDAAIYATSDAFYTRADELLAEIANAVKDMPNCHIVDEQRVRFNATNVVERARFSFRFFCMTASMVFIGSSMLTFKRRPKDGKDTAAQAPDKEV